MQARLAMILSVGGVLVAGTAAAVVNSEVLRQNAAPPVTAPLVSPTTSGPGEADLTLPAPTAPPVETGATTTAPSTTAATAAIVPTTPLTAAPSTTTTAPVGTGATTSGSTTQQTFRLGDAATAILDTAGGVLTIVSVAPYPGWEVDRAEQEDSTSVEIRLRSTAGGDVRFEASLVRGVVVVTVRTDDDTSDDDRGDDDASDDDSSSGSGSGSGDDDSGSGSGSSGHGGGDD